MRNKGIKLWYTRCWLLTTNTVPVIFLCIHDWYGLEKWGFELARTDNPVCFLVRKLFKVAMGMGN